MNLLFPIANPTTSYDFTANQLGGTVLNAQGSNAPAKARSGACIANHSTTDYLLVKMRIGTTLSAITATSAHLWIPPRSHQFVAAAVGVVFDVISSSSANTVAGTIMEYSQ